MDKIKDNEEFLIMVVFEKLFNFIFLKSFFVIFKIGDVSLTDHILQVTTIIIITGHGFIDRYMHM